MPSAPRVPQHPRLMTYRRSPPETASPGTSSTGFSPFPTLADIWRVPRHRPRRRSRTRRGDHPSPRRTRRRPPGPRQPRRRRPGHHRRPSRRRARPAVATCVTNCTPRASAPTGGRMTNPRRMRRHARRMRRYGLQPMVVINSGDPLPDLVIVTLARWLWRYRSELAPLTLAAVTVLAAWVLHATHPHWWPALAAATVAATAGAGIAGARLGLATRGRTRLRHGRHRGHGRMAGRSDRGSARGRDRCRAPGDRHVRARRAVVGAPPAPRQGPRRAQARRLARDRPGGRAGRVAGHVRRGGRVGLAGPVRPGARPDHRPT